MKKPCGYEKPPRGYERAVALLKALRSEGANQERVRLCKLLRRLQNSFKSKSGKITMSRLYEAADTVNIYRELFWEKGLLPKGKVICLDSDRRKKKKSAKKTASKKSSKKHQSGAYFYFGPQKSPKTFYSNAKSKKRRNIIRNKI
jgi:hypothetical protein